MSTLLIDSQCFDCPSYWQEIIDGDIANEVCPIHQWEGGDLLEKEHLCKLKPIVKILAEAVGVKPDDDTLTYQERWSDEWSKVEFWVRRGG